LNGLANQPPRECRDDAEPHPAPVAAQRRRAGGDEFVVT